MLGFWSARTIFPMEILYVAVFIAGFSSIRNTSKPLPDPYLAIAEVLILLMAPILVCLMLAIHECAPRQAKPFTRMALGWMFAAAAFTTVVHFVQLTVARHISSATLIFVGLRLEVALGLLRHRHRRLGHLLRLGPPICRPGVCCLGGRDLGASRAHPQRIHVPGRSGWAVRQRARTPHDRHRWLHDRLRPHLPPAQPNVQRRGSAG
jgi:hypothetical protein